MLKLIGRDPEIDLRKVDLEQHPHPAQLALFMSNNLSRSETALVVRHLLKRCPVCLPLTRELWSLSERAPLRRRVEK